MAKRQLTDIELESVNADLVSGRLDPNSLSPEMKKSLKEQWAAYKQRRDTAKGLTETMLTNKPTGGFLQSVARGFPATTAAMATAAEGAAMGAPLGPAGVLGGAALGAGVGAMGAEAVRQAGVSALAAAKPEKYTAPTTKEVLSKTAEAGGEAAIAELTGRGVVAPVARAATPYVKALGSQIGRWAESASGLEYKTPGVLAEAFERPGLMFSKGRKAVGEMYAAVLNKMNIRPEFAEQATDKEVVELARKFVKDGTLTAEEALVARKALDSSKKKFNADFYRTTRDAFDDVAKTLTAEADAAFRDAIKAEALRSALPVNKGGGTSIFKTVLGKALGGLFIPVLSPAAQGAAASAAGATYKLAAPVLAVPQVSGRLATEAEEQIRALIEMRKKANEPR